MSNGQPVVGASVARIDAADKVTGQALYTPDVELPGMLHCAILHSPHAHAKILSIDTTRAKALPGVHCVLTQADLADDAALVIEDETHQTRRTVKLFADEKVNYQGEKIAAVAADTLAIAQHAVELIEVAYEVLPSVTDPRHAILEGAPLIHGEKSLRTLDDGTVLCNINADQHRVTGDMEAGWAAADRIFENTYNIPRAHQAYLEPQSAVAQVEAQGKVTVWTSTQGIFAVQGNLSKSLRIPLKDVNVIGMTVGGAFGAKFGGITDTYAVLLAKRTRRPVKYVYTRREEFLDGRPAPGLIVTVKTGVKLDGTITARSCTAYWDCGVGGGGLWATSRLKGVYNIPNFELHGYEVNTNKPAPGAYRAPGAPQATFASEAQLDEIAAELGIDPVELRLRNLPEDKPQVCHRRTMLAVAEKAGWATRTKGGHEGWGVAIGEWTNGAGPAGAVVTMATDGSVRVFYGLMDITGTDTAMAQIAAEVLGVPYDQVTVTRGDTDSAPYGTASGGSVTSFSFGNAVKEAAEHALQALLETAARNFSDEDHPVTVDDLEVAERQVWVKGRPDAKSSFAELASLALRQGGPIVGEGRFSPKPSATTISAQIAKVKVDPETGQTQLLEHYQSLDVGKALNPLACEGQMEGGALQSLGWGLMEEMLYDGESGRNLNPDLLDYRLPTFLDSPPQTSVIVEEPTEHGPFGAKGIGEPPITSGLAALGNAIADATGVRLSEPPFTPERVWRALQGK